MDNIIKPSSGHPQKVTPAQDMTEIKSLQQVSPKVGVGRESHSAIRVYEVDISHVTVLRIVHHHGFVIAKHTYIDAGANEAAKEEAIGLCQKNEHWEIENWRQFI